MIQLAALVQPSILCGACHMPNLCSRTKPDAARTSTDRMLPIKVACNVRLCARCKVQADCACCVARMLQLVRMRHQSNAAPLPLPLPMLAATAIVGCHMLQQLFGQAANAQFSNCSTKYLWQYSHFYNTDCCRGMDGGRECGMLGGAQMNSQRAVGSNNK